MVVLRFFQVALSFAKQKRIKWWSFVYKSWNKELLPRIYGQLTFTEGYIIFSKNAA
jgi:hypothetical protein